MSSGRSLLSNVTFRVLRLFVSVMRIKRILKWCWLFTMLAGVLPAGAQGTFFLNAGESVVFQFNGLPLVSTLPNSGLSAFSVQAFPLFAPAEASFRLEMFENSVSEVPICTVQTTGPWRDPEWACFAPGAWQDLQGVGRLTMLTGSARFDEVFAEVQIPQGAGAGQYGAILSPVPEPASISLLILGGCAWVVFRKCRRDAKLKELSKVAAVRAE